MKSNNKHETLSEIKDLYDDISADYDGQEGHLLTEEEKAIWKERLFDSYLNTDLEHILDVGSGTGLLTRFIDELKLSKKITGLEYSEAMIKIAMQHSNSIHYQCGDTHVPDLFENNAFDCIISRQVACHFYDPIAVFTNWYNWLKKDGYVIVVDGLWFREGWSNDKLVDSLPLSCLQTRATLAYLLQQSGFEVIENDFWGDNEKKYFVVGKKVGIN